MKAKKNDKKKGKSTIDKIKKFFDKHWHFDNSSKFNLLEVLVVLIIAMLFGMIAGCILTYGKGYAKVTDNKYISELLKSYEAIVDNYYYNVDEETLVNSAIDGMVKSLDDKYSYYMDTDEATKFNQKIDGSYVGIGATVAFSESGNYVVELYEDSPGEKAGLMVGDVILSIDDTSVVGYTLSELSPLLTGKSGTKFKMIVRRGDREENLTVTRGVVVIPSVNSKIIDGENKKIGYIYIDTFAANTYLQFNKQLKELEKKNINGLIIDVRDNLGGHLDQTAKILSLFFDKKTVLYQISTKDETKKVYSSTKESRDYDIVVLINSFSASASEILASSFQENYKNAVIVGVQSYGKGTVQSAIKLSTGSSLKYTSQRWLTAAGVWLDGVGVTPDVVVEQENDDYTATSSDDTQFEKALEILNK